MAGVKRPWWRFFVILPENRAELEKIFKLNLAALCALGAAAGIFLSLMLLSQDLNTTLKTGFLFIACVLLILPLFADNLLSSIEYETRRKRT
ncbi:hypothetical protein H0O03_00950 [Candidatus Micrarchaeota archaeon]|nr:hypothetical protein [Candidatus Micrarchaeota archaeon]